MTVNTFKPHLMVRNIGKYLIICCLLEKGVATPSGINQWIQKKLMLDKELPSSYLYPTIKELAGGYMPILVLIGKNYAINPELKKDKVEFRNEILSDFSDITKFFDLASNIFNKASF